MSDEKKKKLDKSMSPDESKFPPTQMAINPITGEDITSQVIHNRLAELRIMADNIIQFALWRLERNPQRKMEILKEIDDYLRQKIGCGSIGPATAAAGPLMEEKISELYELFGEDREF